MPDLAQKPREACRATPHGGDARDIGRDRRKTTSARVWKPEFASWLWRRDGATLSAEAAARLRQEQIATVTRATPSMMFANLCNALALMVAFLGKPAFPGVLLWTLCMLAIVGHFSWRYYRRAPGARSGSRPSPRAINKAIANSLIVGLCWAAAPLFFFNGSPAGTQFLIACLCAGMLCGGAFALASIPFAAAAFTLPIVLATAFGFLGAAGMEYAPVVAVLGTYTFTLLRGVFNHAAQMKSRVLLQLRTEEEARTDGLTALPNHIAFHEAVERAFARLATSSAGFVLLYIDIDDFKLVNDRFGRLAGDDLLSRVADRIRARLRSCDFMARLGGDQFAILATDINREEDAIGLAQGVIGCFEAPFEIDDAEVFCGASLGVAIAPRDGDNPLTLSRNGDIALYRAKQKGSLFCLFEPRHETIAREERTLELDLRRSLQSAQFTLGFQPFLDIRAGQVVGCEALLRWFHPTRGAVSPDVFIPIAERTGFIHALGLWVIEAACRAAAGFPPDLRVAINVSAVQLRDPDFAQEALERIAASGLPPSRFEIEITETALLSEDHTTAGSIRKLVGAGMPLSVWTISERAIPR